MFLPFLGYFLTATITMALVLEKKTNPKTNVEQWHVITIGSMTMLFWIYQIYLEIIQLVNGRPTCRDMAEQAKGYFTQGYNFNDLIHLFLTATFVIVNFLEE